MLTEWPNSLIVLNGVVNCRNLPFDGRARRNTKVHLFMKKTRGVATNEGLGILKVRVRELFMHREGISTPCTCKRGQQPLIECAKHDFKIVYFPFLYFLFFWGRQGCCPCSYLSSGAMRNSDLRSSLSLKVYVLHGFYVF